MVSFPLSSVAWSCSFSKFPSPFGKRIADVARVEADISEIISKTKALYAAVDAFQNPGGSMFAALAIYNAATVLTSAIDMGTIDAQNTGPVSEPDGIAIYRSLESLVPIIIEALEMLVIKKPAIDSLPFATSIARRGLKQISDSTSAFEYALLVIAPASLKDDSLALKAVVDAAFEKAIKVYGSV